MAPSSPKHVLDVAMGLFLGTFIGVVLAFMRDRIDERITVDRISRRRSTLPSLPPSRG